MTEKTERCECCQTEEAMCVDYRQRPDLMIHKEFVYDYKTPLTNYLKFVVCDTCFKLDPDLTFYRRMARSNKELLLDRLNSLGGKSLGEKGSPFLKLLKIKEL